MEEMDLQRDLDYFSRLWESQDAGRDPGQADPALRRWDRRAADWAGLLEGDSLFRRSLEHRVEATAAYLRAQGLLGPEDRVVDVGCGAGRFVAEFARTARQVTGLDLSPRMVALGRDYAASQGLSNATFHACDFAALDPADRGWDGAFDLAVASITPALSNLEGLRKFMGMSRAFCFNASHILWQDSLEERIAGELFHTAPTRRNWDGRWFYTLFNLLWLEGYQPLTHYFQQEFRERIPADGELVRYYAKAFAGSAGGENRAAPRIREFLDHIGEGGLVEQITRRRYGWLLWDVRDRTKRA